MDHQESDISFCDISNLSPDVQEFIQKLLSPLNKHNVQVIFPWDNVSGLSNQNTPETDTKQITTNEPKQELVEEYNELAEVDHEKQDENGNTIEDEYVVSCGEMMQSYHIPPPISAGMMMPPNMVPIAGVSSGMPHVYTAPPPFVGYPTVNAELMVSHHMHEQDISGQPIESNMDICMTSDPNDVISTQPISYSTIPQPYNSQSQFFYPTAAPPSARHVIYFPFQYPPPVTYPVLPHAMHPPSVVETSDPQEDVNVVEDSNKFSDVNIRTNLESVEEEEHESSAKDDSSCSLNDKSVEETESGARAWSKPKSWASLFSKNSSDIKNQENELSDENESHQGNNGVLKTDANTVVNGDSYGDNGLSSKIGKSLSRYKSDSKSVQIMPRGLVNRSNWCYINATLQALLVCPPFYNLMKGLPIVPGLKGCRSSSPIIDSLVEFVDNFMNIQANLSKNKRKDDLSVGQPFQPNNIYRMLSGINSSCIKGRQEDAEEFLLCLLDGLHEEMVALIKSANKSVDNLTNGVAHNESVDSKVNGSSDDDWLVIQGKNKGIVTRSTNHVKSPVSDIFGGQLRSVLRKSGTDPSANLEPFFTLQLDVQSSQVGSINDALHSLVSKESVEGCICAKTGSEVEASRRLTLEELPAVLILHIKRFVYNKDGGCQKILKQVEFDMDLDLSPDLLSPEVKLKYKKIRSYRLFAVVYHDGKEAVKGHYVTDSYHSASNGWLRFDDSVVSRITEAQILKHSPPRVPYLLFYRRQTPSIK